VCGAIPDGLLDGILDCLVTDDMHVGRRGHSRRARDEGEAAGFFA
jgi:hypothetical protein